MSFQVLLHPKVAKLEIPKEKLMLLGRRPKLGKRLRYSNFRSLRVGDYRIIYEIRRAEKKVVVLFVGHHKRAYGDISKLL